MDVERRQGEQAEASQARNADAVTALERTVMALTAEVGQLKAQLDHVTAAQAVRDNVPAMSASKKRLARSAQTEAVPPVAGATAAAGLSVSAVPIATTGRVPESSTQIIVQSGDTLWRIARRYHVSVDELRRSNRLEGDIVQTGHVLTIPGPSQAGS